MGHSIANLGDIDKDGYNGISASEFHGQGHLHVLLVDVAISIPFSHHGSSSMIHIYRGSKQGLIPTPSQVSSNERSLLMNILLSPGDTRIDRMDCF